MQHPFVFPLLTLVSALIAIASLGGHGLPTELGFLAKPLTTVLIVLYAWPRGADQPRHALWLRVGLIASIGGDVALLWPESGFVPGLLCFLVAHLSYIRGYATRGALARPLWPYVLYALIAFMLLHRLWPGIPAELRVPVVVYVACLASMAAQAWCWWRRSMGGPDEVLARRAAWGGTLFIFSDALIAINKFAGAVPLSTLWILSSYWLAQWCFASALSPAAAQMSEPASQPQD